MQVRLKFIGELLSYLPLQSVSSVTDPTSTAYLLSPWLTIGRSSVVFRAVDRINYYSGTILAICSQMAAHLHLCGIGV